MKKLFYPVIIAMMLMSQGCFVRNLAGKIDLSRLWKKPEPEAVAVDAVPLADCRIYENKEIQTWPIKYKLDARISGNKIWLIQSGTVDWPVINGTCANAWFFIKINGVWTGQTFDWMRQGAQFKERHEVGAGSMKNMRNAGAIPAGWTPTNVTEALVMVSSLIRGPGRNGNERTNLVKIQIPASWRERR